MSLFGSDACWKSIRKGTFQSHHSIFWKGQLIGVPISPNLGECVPSVHNGLTPVLIEQVVYCVSCILTSWVYMTSSTVAYRLHGVQFDGPYTGVMATVG